MIETSQGLGRNGKPWARAEILHSDIATVTYEYMDSIVQM